MSDDVDDLLRRTMKTLDDQVPAGYFEDLPNRTLARLGDQMQPGSSGTDLKASTGVPPRPKQDDDSGLHDIRSLASSTKARLSSRRSSTQNPIVSDDDILATSSAGWKAVALPEPAKMVSLPELAELPSKREIKEAEKAQRESERAIAKAAKASRKSGEITPPVVEARPAVAVATAVEKPTAKKSVAAVARPQAPTKSRRGPILAVVGIGLAAAAGAVVFVTTQNNKTSDAELTPETTSAKLKLSDYGGIKSAPVPAYQPAATPPTVEPVPPTAGAGSAAAAEPPEAKIATDNPANGATTPKPAPAKHSGKAKAPDPAPTAPSKDLKVEKPTATKDEPKKKGKDGKEGEPSFDELLKEAGVHEPKVEKPKLDKKSLAGDDIKRGMASVAAKAQACYAGTQGTAAVKLTVSPSGQVAKVTVSGPFAGTPVGACVEKAVKSASFPPWDGGPQSFGYSYLLSE